MIGVSMHAWGKDLGERAEFMAIEAKPAGERGAIIVFAFITAALYGIAQYSFLAFHTLAETFAVVVSCTAFAVAWYSRKWIGSNYLLMLGIGQAFVAVIDIAHTLSYKGMAVIPGADIGSSSQYWIAARGIEAISFLIALAWPMRRFPAGIAITAYAIVTALAMAAILGGLFPTTFIEGQGLTPFKVFSEYVIVAVLCGALYLLRRNGAHFDPVVSRLLALALAAKIGSELCFTLYVDVYGISNFVGHIFKIVFAYLFLRALVETGLARPQALVFGAIEREKRLADEVRCHAGTLDAVLDSSLDPVAMIGNDGRFQFVSRAAEAFFGRSSDELCGKTWRDAGLSESVMVPIQALCAPVYATARPVTAELTVADPDGRRWLEAQVSPVRPAMNGHAEAVVLVLRDITARKVMEDDLKASLDDNRVLVQEVHHRVKNNLQIVSSILQMQGWRLSDPSMRIQFEEACGRILSLAKVHEMLHKQDSAASVDFVRYVRTLCDELFNMYGVRQDWIHLRIKPGSLMLELDKAVPLSLIVHELMTNAVKHAFTERGGELSIQVEGIGGRGRLVVTDDGKGMDATDFERHTNSLGVRMVSVLTKQIHGTLTTHSPIPGGKAGTRIEIEFPLEPSAPVAMEDMSLMI